MDKKLNSEQFIQVLHQNLLDIKESAKEYFFDCLLELFQYQEVETVVINSYASLGVELKDPTTQELVFIAINNSTTTQHNNKLSYHLVVHDEVEQMHLLSNVIQKYESIYKQFMGLNHEYVTPYQKPASKKQYDEPRIRIEKHDIETARKLFFTPEHYEKYKAKTEKKFLEEHVSKADLTHSQKIKV